MSINPPGRWQRTGRGARFMLDPLEPTSTLTLTWEQAYHLKCSFDAAFTDYREQNAVERDLAKRLDRMVKRLAHKRKAQGK